MRKHLTKMMLLIFVLSTVFSIPSFAADMENNSSFTLDEYAKDMSDHEINSEASLPTEEDKQKNAEFDEKMDRLKEAYYQYFRDEITIEELQRIENESFSTTATLSKSVGLTSLAEGTQHRDAVEKYKDMFSNVQKTNAIIAPYNIGDYEYMNVGASREYQYTTYYCGPATATSIVNGYGKTYISQDTAASLLGTTQQGTGFDNRWLNVLNPTYTNAYYQLAWGWYGWAANLADRTITSFRNGHAVALDVVMNTSTIYLPGYSSWMGEVRHYIAGCGFDSTDPSRRYIRYFDPNGAIGIEPYQKVSYQDMALATQTLGIVHAY